MLKYYSIVTNIMFFIDHQKEKLNLLHTIDDAIVHDGVAAIEYIDIPHAIAGGMAVQTYVPDPEFYRPTSDVDAIISKPSSYPNFKNSANYAMKELNKKGYKTQISESKSTFNINMSHSGDKLSIQFKKKSPANFEKHRESIEREVDSAKKVERNGIIYRVLRSEDIILQKLDRLYRMYKEGNSQIQADEISGDKFWVPDRNIVLHRKHVKALRNWASETMAFEDVSTYRMEADIFDINVLLMYQDFDMKYFEEGIDYFRHIAANKKTVLKNMEILLGR